MGKISMKGQTPCDWRSLCMTCTWAHIVTGFRESEFLVVCTEVNPNISMTFLVRECTSYCDRNKPNYDAMQKLAIDIKPSSTLKPIAGFKAKGDAIEDEDTEVARTN